MITRQVARFALTPWQRNNFKVVRVVMEENITKEVETGCLSKLGVNSYSSNFSMLYSFSFSVVESLDNGKSIRETRDADIPLVVRHFYHHAGWAQLMDTEMAQWKSVGVYCVIETT